MENLISAESWCSNWKILGSRIRFFFKVLRFPSLTQIRKPVYKWEEPEIWRIFPRFLITMYTYFFSEFSISYFWRLVICYAHAIIIKHWFYWRGNQVEYCHPKIKITLFYYSINIIGTISTGKNEMNLSYNTKDTTYSQVSFIQFYFIQSKRK